MSPNGCVTRELVDTSLVEEEIAAVLNELDDTGEVWEIIDITFRVLDRNWDKISPGFSYVNNYENVYNRSKRRISKRLAIRHHVTQLGLFGQDFPRLQARYETERNGLPCAVLLTHLTDEELEAKALELETMGVGCFAHAAEVRRYLTLRRAQPPRGRRAMSKVAA